MLLLMVVALVLGQLTAVHSGSAPHATPAHTVTRRPLVVGTLTTIPARLPWLHEAVESLCNQTWQLDTLLLVYPLRTPDGTPTPPLPRRIARNPCVTVIQTAGDWGPVGKLLPAVLLHAPDRCKTCGPWLTASQGEVPTRGGGTRRMERDSRVITFDDDRVYTPWTVELLVRASLALPDAVIGTEGHFIDQTGCVG
jgi:hypothetical protein